MCSTHALRPLVWAVAATFLACAGIAVAQDADPNAPDVTVTPATAMADDPNAPAAVGEAEFAETLEVNGQVQHAPVGSDEWQTVAVGDRLPPETQIRTGLRSSVKFRIGDEPPYTALVIDSVGKVVLDEAYRTEQRQRVRIGVGYGQIRAGVASGGRQADLTVDTPAMTASKRGTWGIEVSYERYTNSWRAGLVDSGELSVLDRVNEARRRVVPQEFVDDRMMMWMDQAQLARNASMVDILGQENIKIAYSRMRNAGLGVLDPGSGYVKLVGLGTGRVALPPAGIGAVPPPIILPPGLLLPGGGTYRVPAANFGFGRGGELLEAIVGQ